MDIFIYIFFLNFVFQIIVHIHNKNINLRNTYIQSINKYIAVKKNNY